jgi:hypothetical protein
LLNQHPVVPALQQGLYERCHFVKVILDVCRARDVALPTACVCARTGFFGLLRQTGTPQPSGSRHRWISTHPPKPVECHVALLCVK